MSWTIDEWFVIALARTIRPRETVFHGFGSPRAQVAMHVARRSHAPDMTLAEGAMYAVNPEVAGDLRTATPPSTAKLATARSVDPLQVRTWGFSRRELDRAFERGDGQDCAC